MNPTVTPTDTTAQLSGKYLTVLLNGESYGMAVKNVREIIRHQRITPVPQMPSFVKGVINLRGRLVPVIDLRSRFDLPAGVADRTCIVVTQVTGPAGQSVQIGLVVDGVEDVAQLTDDEIEAPPAFGIGADSSYLLGMARTEGRVIMLLHLDRTVGGATIAALSTPVT